MSRYEPALMMPTYTDDFGNEYDNIPVKIQRGAPGADSLYAVRTDGLCAPTKLVSPRALYAKFADGRELKYPVPLESSVVSSALTLRSNGAICIDYVGEKWNFIIGATIGGNLAYRSTEYTGLVASKKFEVGSFDYTSSLGITGLGTFKLPFRIAENDDATLRTCQRAGLASPAANTGICAAKGIITARFYTIRANADDGGKVARKAMVSVKSSLATTATAIAPCASCLSYQGESVKGLEGLI